MEPFRHHVLVCTQEKAEGVPCCSAAGAWSVLNALHRELGAQGLSNQVQVSSCGCLGLCDSGPVMIAYPDGAWYTKLTPADVPEIVTSHFKNGQRVARLERTDYDAMKTEILDHRDKYLAMLKGKDAAGVFPDDLNETIRGFMPSRVILTALELDVFTAVGSGATALKIAGTIQAAVRSTEMLLDALVSLKLLQKHDGVYSNAPVAARFLVEGVPDSARAGQMHTVNMWRRWSTLTEAVKSGTSVATTRDATSASSFIAAMDVNSRGRAPAVAQAVGLNDARHMLDLGGGSGAYSIAFARSAPNLECEVVDLPEVLPITEDYIRKAEMTNRIRTRPGNMQTMTLPQRHYDLVLLSAICHMFSPEENQQLLERCLGALAPGGRIVVSDFILEPDKTAPRQAALFALNMLVGTRAGASYSEPEYAAWLKAAGFGDIKRVRLPGPAGLMIATRP